MIEVIQIAVVAAIGVLVGYRIGSTPEKKKPVEPLPDPDGGWLDWDGIKIKD